MKTTDAIENKSYKLLSTQEAANAWGISRWMLYDLVKSGKIRPIVGFGKGWKFQMDDWSSINLTRL